jgi:uncharacterized coiled-coil protein SlyX
MNVTKPKKTVSRNAALALGIICVVVVAGLVGAFAYYVNERNNAISSLNSQVASLKTEVSYQNSTVSSLNNQISELNSNITSLQNQVRSYNSTISLMSGASASAILYATYNVSWGQNSSKPYDLISGGGELSVANYSSMSVFLEFENVSAEDEEWNALWTVFAYWYLDINGTFAAFDYLPFTVGTVTLAVGVQPVGVYSIKAPYVSLTPTLINVYDCGLDNQFSPQANESATAVCKIYVYLSRNEGTSSDQAMNDQMIGVIHDAATTTGMTFGPYLTEGYSEIYVQMTSNVSCSVIVDNMLYPSVIYDSFSIFAGNEIQKNYEVQSQQIRIEFSTVAPVPWEVYVRIYLKP